MTSRQQFMRHTTAKRARHYEYSMKVFNTTVENHVEMPRRQMKNAHSHGGLYCLHKLWCNLEGAKNNSRADLSSTNVTFKKINCQSIRSHERSVPAMRRFKLDFYEFFGLVHDVIPLAVCVPARGNHLD
jgi:hypothetical protein